MVALEDLWRMLVSSYRRLREAERRYTSEATRVADRGVEDAHRASKSEQLIRYDVRTDVHHRAALSDSVPRFQVITEGNGISLECSVTIDGTTHPYQIYCEPSSQTAIPAVLVATTAATQALAVECRRSNIHELLQALAHERAEYTRLRDEYAYRSGRSAVDWEPTLDGHT